MVMIAIGLAALATVISLLVLLNVARRLSPISDALPIRATAYTGPVERLSFADSLDPERFATAAEAATLDSLFSTRAILADDIVKSLHHAGCFSAVLTGKSRGRPAG